MALLIYFILPVFFVKPNSCGAQHVSVPRNYLSGILNKTGFRITSQVLQDWRQDLKKNQLKSIELLPDSAKRLLLLNAADALHYNWPALSAGDYLEYKRTGNRTGFEKKQTERRNKLNSLAIGELIQRNNKYVPQLVNGLWATLEESSWEIPAIIGLQKAGTGLPDPGEEVIGLVSAETAVMLASVQFMLYDQLDMYSPMINKRITAELQKRIFDPYLQRDDYWWMGFSGKPVNNWNAWVNTNIFQTTLLTGANPDIVNSIMQKVFRSTDNFINQYPADGGCDEGASYWSLAGGKLIRLLHLATSVSGSVLNWRNEALLHQMGTYILKMHIAEDYFVNFADAAARTIPNPASVYQYGELFSDDSLKEFGAWLFSMKKNGIPDLHIADFLETAILYQQLSEKRACPSIPLSFAFLNDLQVFTARSEKNTGAGIFLAVQGGHNGESHNHNDVGNFILYVKGRPVIIDAGVGTYTSKTFSNERYNLWNMQSQWHNCPLINGVMQEDGPEFRAKNVAAEKSKNGIKISMNIDGAYPPAANVRSWVREFLFNQESGHVKLTDNYLLDTRKGDTRLNFLTYCEIREGKRGEIHFYDGDGNETLMLEYPSDQLDYSVEVKAMDDEKMIASWGNKLSRLSFTVKGNSLKGKHIIGFSMPAQH